MSIISAGTTLTTALVQTGDTNGNLVFKTGASGTTALTLGSDQSATFAGAVSFSGGASISTLTFAAGSAASPSITFTGDTNTGIFSPAADTIAFTEGGVESMRIDPNGKLGVGVSSVNSGFFAQFNGSIGLGNPTRNQATTALIGVRTSNDPVDDQRCGITFGTTAGASSSNSYLAFNTNQYGVSGGERMRIDSSGNVGIGTSSPGARLQIGSATFAPNANLGNNLLQIKSPSGFAYVTFGNGDQANSTSYIGGASGLTAFGSVSDAGSLSEYMRITNTGNVGIGTSSPNEAMTIQRSSGNAAITLRGAGNTSSAECFVGQGGDSVFYIYNRANTGITFGTNNVAQAIITNTGNLQFNSGYGSVATAYGCRAWVCFNGTTSPTIAILGSGNVSSVSDNAVGVYTVNFSTAMVDANYSCVTGLQRNATSDFINEGFNRGTSSTRVESFSGGVTVDFPKLQLAFFR